MWGLLWGGRGRTWGCYGKEGGGCGVAMVRERGGCVFAMVRDGVLWGGRRMWGCYGEGCGVWGRKRMWGYYGERREGYGVAMGREEDVGLLWGGKGEDV